MATTVLAGWAKLLILAHLSFAPVVTAAHPQSGAPQPRSTQDDHAAAAGTSHEFQVGVASCDITPTQPVPMWGYGVRHDRLSQGTLDPLLAKALVIQAGTQKLALVAMDLGRGPTPAMLKQIRDQVAPRGINHVLVCGSHTHHGPVIELSDQPGYGKGKFDAAVAYARDLPDYLAALILEADCHRQPALLGAAARDLSLNRNRQTKRPERFTDPRLTVIRFDRPGGKPLAILVHYTAHPVLTPIDILKFSADYPGHLCRKVEQELGAPCLFLQGAAGDQSANPPQAKRNAKGYGELLADQATDLARGIVATEPRRPSIAAIIDHFQFGSRVNFKSPIRFLVYANAFFPELVRNYIREFEGGLKPEVTTLLLNRELAFVGLPGEPFCQHAVRLRQRAYLPWTLVLGYCNGHLLYFPTIEAASEGGYGADPEVSPIALGAGEQMINQALISLYRLLGKFPAVPAESFAQPEPDAKNDSKKPSALRPSREER